MDYGREPEVARAANSMTLRKSSEIVKPIHAKAMPVLLTTDDEAYQC